MKKIVIRPNILPRFTEVYVGRNLLWGDLWKNLFEGKKTRFVIIADQALKEVYGTKLASHLNAELLTIPSGEKTKSQDVLDKLMEELFILGVNKDTVLIALGGGVTLDLVSFAASIYMRGVQHILIPTTLLGMVDAAIGGKTAIDTAFGKNLIGSIYHPKAIVADVETLSTLPETEWVNGLAEILKMGLIFDAGIWELGKKDRKDPELILKAIGAKIEIVEQDSTEQSLRRILNFGHTIGHGLEAVARYGMPHGRAVALGCVVESYLSWQLGYLSVKDVEGILALYDSFFLQLPDGYSRQGLLQALSYDKKRSSGQMRFVLIDEIGHAMPFDGAYCRSVSLSELESSLDWMENTYG
jgi:3-dehydroquinate synthase